MSLFRKLVGIFQAAGVALRKRLLGGGPPVYVEEVFSTFLYTGTGAGQYISNGIDFSTKGGMVWLKARNDTRNNWLYDTNRGYEYGLRSDLDFAQNFTSDALTGFFNDGFNIGASGNINTASNNLVSWSFRKQPKFFDVVTYTGDGTVDRNIAHNLGSTPGWVMVKKTSIAGDWLVSVRDINSGFNQIKLNTTAAIQEGSYGPVQGMGTNTTFNIWSGGANDNGDTYVAYLFAHNAGGFGLTGNDNVISCGTFDANLGEVINLGYEPQWLLYRDSSIVNNWRLADNMRGFTNLSGTNAQTIQQLTPNTTAAEAINSGPVLTPTGFRWNQSGGGNKHIYMAIRRGPMKVPTVGTNVFSPNFYSSTTTAPHTVTTNFSTDMTLSTTTVNGSGRWIFDRLRSNGPTNGKYIGTDTTAAEANYAPAGINFQSNTSVIDTGWNAGNPNTLYWNFRRAPSFFDEVCYTGAGSGQTISHNLGVAPELIIFKKRGAVSNWTVVTQPVNSNAISLNLNDTTGTSYIAFVTTYGATSITTEPAHDTITENTTTYVAYLFATCAGVSKVGSYTGTATTKQIDCGFTTGARFVMIKRTDATSDWYVWDTERGIIAGNDPYLLLNSTAAGVTNTDYIDPYSPGFELSSTAPAALNANGGTYIFLAIA